MESAEGDSEEEFYFSAAEEELPSRPWTEDDEMSVARPGSSGGPQASSASLLSTASFPTTAERPAQRLLGFALLLVHLAWFDSLAALCVDALFFGLLEHASVFDLTILTLSAARSFGSLTFAAAFIDGRHSERKYIVMLILSAFLLAVCVFISCQTVFIVMQLPFNTWLSSFSSRLHLSSCALNVLGTLLYFTTTVMIIAFLHERGNASISSHLISRKHSRSSSSDTSSHFIEL